jgi:hypothetical protein
LHLTLEKRPERGKEREDPFPITEAQRTKVKKKELMIMKIATVVADYDLCFRYT